MILPTTIISISLAMVSSQQLLPDDAHLLIERLDEIYHFDHHIFLIDTATDLSRWFSMYSSSTGTRHMDAFTTQTIHTLSSKHYRRLNVVGGKNTFLIVVTEALKIGNKSQMFDQVKAIRKLDKNMKIGVFLAREISSLNGVKHLFRWSWTAGIVNIFCAFHFGIADPTFNVFRYDPFGTFDLVNVTGSESIGECFPDKRPNYRKHPLRFQVAAEVSHIYFNAKFWKTVCRAFNASIKRKYVTTEQLRAGKSHVVDIHHYEEILLGDELVQMYPHRQTILVLAVPHARPYSHVAIYLESGTWTVLFVFASIVIASSSLLLIVSSYFQGRKIVILRCVADVLNLLVNDNTKVRYQNLYRADTFIVVPLTFTGVIVMNGIVSLFQSFITTPIYEPQIDTLEALYKSSVAIMEPDVAWTDKYVEILTDITKDDGWRDKWKNDSSTSERATALFLYKEEIEAWLEVEKRLALKWLHMMTDTFLARHLLAFKISSEYPFTEHIKSIMHALDAGGHSSKWKSYAQRRSVERMYGENFHLQFETDNGSDTGEFEVPTVVWFGWIASAMVFICEIIRNKVTLSYKSYNIRWIPNEKYENEVTP